MQEFSIQTQAMEILSCVLEDIPKTSDKEVAPAFSSCLGTLGTHKRSKKFEWYYRALSRHVVSCLTPMQVVLDTTLNWQIMLDSGGAFL